MRDSLFCEAGLVVAAVGGWRQRGIAGCTLITGYYLPLVQLSTSVKFSPGVAAVAAASVSFVAFAAPASGEVSRFTDSEVVRLTRVASSCQAASSSSTSSSSSTARRRTRQWSPLLRWRRALAGSRLVVRAWTLSSDCCAAAGCI